MLSKQSVLVAVALIGMANPVRAQFTMPPPPAGEIVALTADVTVITSLSSQLGASTQTQTGKYYRSSGGKTRQDTVTASTILDPQARTVVSLNHARMEANVSYLPSSAGSPGQNPPGGGTPQKLKTPSQDLGEAVISGQTATGKRITTSNPFGLKVGAIITEVWTAGKIGLPVLMTQNSPAGATTQKFENIQLGEPDPALFVIPAGYKVQRATPAQNPATTASH